MNDATQPTRIIIRSMLDFMLNAVQAYAHPLGGDLLDTVVFATIQTANITALTQTTAGARRLFEAMDDLIDDQLRPVSINAIAKSFSIPYETARGATNRLIGRGYCRKSPRGFIVPAAAFVRPEIAEADHAVSLVLDQTLSRLSRIGFDFDQLAAMGGPAAAAETVSLAPPPPRYISWHAIEFMLRTVETTAPTFGDFTSGFIFAGVMTANTRELIDDSAQAWSFADMHSPPPDSLRRPVSVRSLSEQLNIPFETVRRHVNRLVEGGLLLRLDDGVIAPTEVMQDPRLLSRSPLVALRFTRMIADLKRAGYVFAPPAAGAGAQTQPMLRVERRG